MLLLESLMMTMMQFIFTHQGNGAYITTGFVPVINQSYTLEVIHEEETVLTQQTRIIMLLGILD